MTSTASQRLRLDKQATGDNPDAWGDRLNGVIDLVDESFGFAEIAVNGNVSLSTQNFVSDQSRRMVLRFTGSGGFSVTIPAVEHMYYIDNRCPADVILKTASTPGAVVVAGSKRIAYCDGANVNTDTSTGAPPASSVAFSPTAGLSSTNVQAALAELSGNAWQTSNTPRLISNAGYQKFPSGLIMQWAYVANTASDYGINYPIAFPNDIFSIVAQVAATNPTAVYTINVDNVTKVGCAFRLRSAANGGVVSGAGNLGVYYTALGF
jgi:hypothetical protein